MTDQPSTNAGVARASALLALGNIASRVLGLMREVVLANVIGVSSAQTAFNNAVLVSRSIFDLLIAGHLSSAIVPVLSEIEAAEGREALRRVLRAMAGLILVVVGAFALMILPLADPIAGLLGGDDSETVTLSAHLLPLTSPAIAGLLGGDDLETLTLTAHLLRLTSPAIVLLALFSLYSGALYALRSFTYPAMAAAVFNGTLVVLTLAGGALVGGENTITVVALAWVAAAAAQLALQLWGLRGRGSLWPTFDLRDRLVRPVLGKIGRLYVPVIGATILDIATTRFLTYALAASAAIAYGNVYIVRATTLMQFPQGLVATAISAAVLPTLSRSAALVRDDPNGGHAQGFADTLGYGLRLTTALILPAAVGLAVLAIPTIQLLFEHGTNTSADTAITATALRVYLVGVPFAAWDLLLIYGFYARQDTRTPALVGVVSLVTYTLAALLLTPIFDLYALMMADAVKHITHALISAVLLWRRIGGLPGQRLAATLFKALAACAVMVGTAAVMLPLTEGLANGESLSEAVRLALLLAGCGGAYLGAAFVLRIDDLRGLAGLVLRRRG
jgi:putative peptidoglycan lipid II flippase